MLVTRKDPELIGTSEVFRVTHNCNPITWEVEAELLSLAFFWSQPGIHSESLFRKENLREIQSQFYFRLPPKIISDYQILLPRNRFPPQARRLASTKLSSPDPKPRPSSVTPLHMHSQIPRHYTPTLPEPHSSTTVIFVIVRQLRKAKSALASIWGHGLTHAHCLFAIE